MDDIIDNKKMFLEFNDILHSILEWYSIAMIINSHKNKVIIHTGLAHSEKIVYYFTNNFIIKDDQTIIMDIIFCNQQLFYIHTEANPYMDNWFMFQRLLF